MEFIRGLRYLVLAVRPNQMATLIPVIISTLLLTIMNSSEVVKLPITDVTFVLTFSLGLQSIISRYVIFESECNGYSEHLGTLKNPIRLSSFFGPFIATLFISMAKYILAIVLIFALIATNMYEFDLVATSFHIILCALLLDPIIAIIWNYEHYDDILDFFTYITGYLSILLIGVGANSTEGWIAQKSVVIYIFFLAYILLNARLTFFREVAFQERIGIRVFAPFIFAFLFAVLQNLTDFLTQL